ncbi:MAG: 50S ribosomal protein L22 [Elusimicrobia bacterium]|nr:50S ribosomal protein L22 [Elusimicrobiota bacterium]MBU2614535.1 50S ribosomal protein L22 [Elusimicrobiota bacterium]
MEATAKANFIRIAPRKIGQMLTLIRKKPVKEAFKILMFAQKSPKTLIEKTLKSAVANIGRLKTMDGVFVKECYVNGGPSLKRWRARAFGRAAQYKHRTSHLIIIVADKKI